MARQSIYLGWRFYRDINTESVVRELVYLSNDWDDMVKTLESEFDLNGREFVELNENAEVMSEKVGYYGSLFIEEQLVDCFWNGYEGRE